MNYVFLLFCVEYLPANGQKNPEHAGVLLHDCFHLNLTDVWVR
jgi:hypothetical protein